MAPQIPSAALRRCGGTAALRRVSDKGMIMAPPAPWRARAVTSTAMLGAMAASAEAPVNRAMPRTKMRLRPNRSPTAAADISSTAKVSVYALTVHSSPDRPAWRWTRITGRAVETTRLSSEAMNRARPVTTTAQMALDRAAGEIAGALTGDDPLAPELVAPEPLVPELVAPVPFEGGLTAWSGAGAGRCSSARALPRRGAPERRAVRHPFGCE